MNFARQFEKCETIADYFMLVKDVVRRYLGLEQAGLMLGLTDLGTFDKGFIGAYYTLHSNMIMLNRTVLDHVRKNRPDLYKHYLFHLILHEYVHSVGIYDEKKTRKIVYEISKKIGDRTLVDLAIDMSKFFPEVMVGKKVLPKDINIEFVHGIDKKNLNYIG